MVNLLQKYSAEAILGFFVLVFVGFHFWGYIGHYGYDDMEYAMLARDWTHGIFHPDNHFSYRMTITGMTALSYMIFGVSDFASALPPIVLTIAILALVYQVLRSYGNTALFAGLALTLLSNWFIFYADKLMPDIYVAFSVFAGVVVLYLVKFGPSSPSSWRYPALFVLALFFGFLSKGTILLALPLFALFFVIDALRREHLDFWMRVWILGAAVLGAYFISCYALTGNAFARFDALYANSYINQCSYDQQPLPILLDRIFHSFFERMLSAGMVTAYFFVIPVAFSKKGRALFLMRTPLHFFAASALILLLLANFMSISLTSYSPMCLDQRHYLYLVPVAGIAGGMAAAEFFDRKNRGRSIVLTLLLGTFGSWFAEGNAFHKLYLPLLVLVLIYWLTPGWRSKKPIFIVLFGAILALLPFEFVQFARVLDYRAQREVFEQQITEANPVVYVITDAVSANLGDYYGGFEPNRKYTFLRFGSFDLDTLDSRPKWVYSNSYNQGLSGLTQEDLPGYAQKNAEGHHTVFQNEGLGIRVVELNESLNLTGAGTTLYQTRLGFESPTNGPWSENSGFRTDSIAYSGKNSALSPEYSASFRFSLDSLPNQDFDALRIEAEVQVNSGSPTSAVLVVTAGNGDKTLYWDSYAVNRPMKAYGLWWELTAERAYRSDALPPGTVLSVYVWNKDLDALYLDDFEVRIVGLNDIR